MLHWASTAKVDSPLAFDAGVFPDAGTGVGVAQIHGVVCEPNSTGPPIGWLRIQSVALGRPCPLPFESARNSFSPTTSPVRTPRIVRAASLVWNADVTSFPLSHNVTFFSGTFLGTRTSTSASPPLMRSERFDSVTISKFRGVGSASARKSVVNRHPDSTTVLRNISPVPANAHTIDKAVVGAGCGPGVHTRWRSTRERGVQAAPGAPRGLKFLGIRAGRRKAREAGGEASRARRRGKRTPRYITRHGDGNRASRGPRN